MQAQLAAHFLSEVFLNEVQKVAKSRGGREKSLFCTCTHTHAHTMETLVSNINKRWVVTPELFFLTASGGSDESVKLSNFPLF